MDKNEFIRILSEAHLVCTHIVTLIIYYNIMDLEVFERGTGMPEHAFLAVIIRLCKILSLIELFLFLPGSPLIYCVPRILVVLVPAETSRRVISH